LPPDAWAAEGRRTAPALEDVAAALVIGNDVDVAAIVAIALARAQPADRRVAIGDLVGDLGSLRGAPGSPGLLECFRDGLPVSGIARPLAEDDRIFVLPSGDGPVAQRLVFESARWPRLVSGFREVDALLLLVAPADAPGLDSLIATLDGVVAVDLPPTVARRWPLLATIDRPEAELPLIGGAPAIPPRRRRRGALMAVGVLAIGGAAALVFALTRRTAAPPPPAPDPARVAGASASDAGGPAAPQAGGRPVAPDTISLGAVVNPGDSTLADVFTLELVAANTLAGANSLLEMRGVSLPAPTLAPVLLGADGRPWFRALAGAWRDRSAAEAFLTTLRDRGLVRQDLGRVLRAPYALLLAEGMPPAAVPAALARWEARGIPAYALLQDDGRARLFAGAFETPGQSVLLALSLRDLGVVPTVAFRTGRTF
jgi:hypothetical protein